MQSIPLCLHEARRIDKVMPALGARPFLRIEHIIEPKALGRPSKLD